MIEDNIPVLSLKADKLTFTTIKELEDELDEELRGIYNRAFYNMNPKILKSFLKIMKYLKLGNIENILSMVFYKNLQMIILINVLHWLGNIKHT